MNAQPSGAWWRLAAGIVLAIGCGRSAPGAAPPPTVASASASASTSTSASAAPAAGAPPTPIDPCPERLEGAPPGVHVFANLAEAARHLAYPDVDAPGKTKTPDLVAMAKSEGDAFFVETFHGYLHESSTSRRFRHAVFVRPKKVVVVSRVLETVSALPGPCGNGRQGATVAVRIVTTGSGSAIGHLRVVRAGVADTPTTATTLAKRATCDDRVRYRVEDHFVDLVTGEHLRSVAQVFEAHVYGSDDAPPTLGFDAFALDADGYAISGTECRRFWDDY